MVDVVLPLECLAEELAGLQALKNGTAILPPWLNKTDIPRLIAESEKKVQELEAHVAKWGNTWETIN